MAAHSKLNLRSDNEASTHPAFLQAIERCARQASPAYGADQWTGELNAHFSQCFDRPSYVLPLISGTAANALAVAQFCQPYGAVLCHEEAHMAVDECGAPEFFSGGAKLLALTGPGGKITPETLRRRLAPLGAKGEHDPIPQMVSITQATEWGCCYTLDELAALRAATREADLSLHIDGARLGNALAFLGVSPAQFMQAAQPDALSFGLSKTGAMAADALLVFDEKRCAGLGHRRMKAGHLPARLKFVSAQLLAGLEDDLWLSLSAQANQSAREIAQLLEQAPGAELVQPVEANEIFVRLQAGLHQRLERAGVAYHPWPGKPGLYRMVAGWDLQPEQLEILKRTLE